MQGYLTLPEAAIYLRLSERKLYDLVGRGAVPSSKASGRWLFNRIDLDRWLAVGAGGVVPTAVPPILGGSNDPLLDWAVRESRSGLALLSEGSMAGLDRLAVDEIAIAAIHLHPADPTTGEAANIVGLRSGSGFHDVVLIGFVRREQGLLTAPGNPRGLSSLRDAVDRRARFALRRKGAGAELLLTTLLAAEGLAPSRLASTGTPAATGQDLALAIRAGNADCGVATRAVAETHSLGFISLAWEDFDLALRRRTYFEQGPQRLFDLMRTERFRAQAEGFGGYDLSNTGVVRFNA